MYKLIVMDLDGTLLNSYGEVSQEDKEAIQEAMNRGIDVVLASGRVSDSVKNLSNELGIKNYFIAGNGTIVYDIKKDEIVYERFIERKKVLKIIKMCEENSIYYNLYTENETIAKSLNYNILFYNYENSKKADDKKTKITLIDDIYEYVERNKDVNVAKITVCDSNKIIFDRILEKIKKNVSGINILNVSHMASKIIYIGTEQKKLEYYFTEVSKKDTNKWEAIKYILDKKQIKPEEVLAIGDNSNDKEMIENAGLGIVMKKSALEAKKIGDYITKSNNESGVAHAIKKYILQEDYN